MTSQSTKAEKMPNNMHVTFGTLTVYEFPVVIGDNPNVREGCPIRMGDDLLWKKSLDVDTYETERAPRGHGKELYIPVQDRAAILLSQGCTLEEIVGAVMGVEEIKKSRSESLKMNNREKLVILRDSAGRALRKIVRVKPNEDKPNSVQARSA